MNFQLCDHWVIYATNIIKIYIFTIIFESPRRKFHLLNITTILHTIVFI